MHKRKFGKCLPEQQLGLEPKPKLNTSSQTIAKPLVKRSVWVVYPDSVRMGLSGENKPAAWFIHKHHADNYGQVMWERFYKVEQVEIHCV